MKRTASTIRLLLWLACHEWRDTTRSVVFYRNLAATLGAAAIGTVAAVNLVFIGFALDDLLVREHLGQDPIRLLSGFVLHFLLAGFLLRLATTSTSGLRILPYLALPIPRHLLIHWDLARTLPSSYNLFPLFLLLPFDWEVGVQTGRWLECTVWLLAIMLLNLACGLAALLLRRSLFTGWRAFAVGTAAAAILLGGGLTGLVPLSRISAACFHELDRFPALLAIPFLAALGAYAANYRQLSGGLSLDRLQDSGHWNGAFDRLARNGRFGWPLRLELELLFRTRRGRSALLFGILVPFLGWLWWAVFPADQVFDPFGSASGMEMTAAGIFAGLLLTGLPMIVYGQFLLAWESNYIELIATRPLSWIAWFQARYRLLLFLATLGFAVTLPQAVLGREVLRVHLACWVFHLGVTATILLLLAGFTRKRLLLSESYLTSQGRGAGQYLILVPTLLPAGIVIALVYAAGHTGLLFGTLLAIGVTGLAAGNLAVRSAEHLFQRQRYRVISGFRNS